MSGRVNIDPETWAAWNASLRKHAIKQRLWEMVKGTEPPYVQISLPDAMAAFDLLRRTDWLPLIRAGEWGTRYAYKYRLDKVFIDINNAANDCSNYFHQESRWEVDCGLRAPIRVWRTERFFMTITNALFSLKVSEVNDGILRNMIALRGQFAAQFRPTAAKAIYQYFAPKRVLDFSSGWGDRLAGFCAYREGEHYTGIDPNTKLRNGYFGQLLLYGDARKTVELIPKPAEDVALEPEQFDLVFTSPPYFDQEHYADDAAQSFRRYAHSVSSWRKGFLFPTLTNAYNALRSGGFLAVNISDSWGKGGVQQLCDPMNDYLASLGASYCACWGLRIHKRPQSLSAEREGVFGEPIWIWHKGPAVDLPAPAEPQRGLFDGASVSAIEVQEEEREPARNGSGQLEFGFN